MRSTPSFNTRAAWRPISCRAVFVAVPIRGSYLALADVIRSRIERGEYVRKIPSLGALIKETGLATKTVQKGIRLLVEEGLVVIVAGKGTYVAER